MKFAIFGLLAFCTCQRVFALGYGDTFPKDIIHPDQGIIDKLAEVLDKYENPFRKGAEAVHIEGVDYDSLTTFCLADADRYNGFDKKYHTAKDQCTQCRDELPKTDDTEVTQNCCDKIITKFEKATKLYIHKATACVAKCVKLGAGCKKMLQELEKKFNKDYLNVW